MQSHAGLLAAIVESSTDAIIGQTLDGIVTSWNGGAQRLYGWAEGAIVGASAMRLVPDMLHEEFRFLLERVANGERVNELLTRRRTKSGYLVYVSITAAPVMGDDGRVVGIATIERDVTHRRRVDAIADGQRRMLETLTRTGRLSEGLRDLLDAAAGLTAAGTVPSVMELDAEHHILIPVGSRLPDAVTEALADGVAIAPRAHPSGEAAFRRQAVSVADLEQAPEWGGLRDVLLQEGFRACSAVPILSPTGEILGSLDLYAPTPGDPDAEDLEVASALAHTAAIAIERFKTVRDLRSGREVLSALYEINALLGAELDAARIIKRATEEATRLLGAEAGGFFQAQHEKGDTRFVVGALAGPGRDVFTRIASPSMAGAPLLRQASLAGVIQRFDDVTRDPRYASLLTQRRGRPAPPRIRSFMSAPVRTRSGELIGLLLFGHSRARQFTHWHEEIVRGVVGQTALAVDTARLFREAQERAQALESANRRKTEFLALLGHELRNPLGALVASLEVVSSQPRDSAAVDDALSIMQRQTKNMRRLVDDLLDVSRITRGKISLQRQLLDLQGVVTAACEAAKARRGSSHVRIETETDPGPVWVEGDPVRLEQVVTNLITNAVKFSPGRGTVTVRLKRSEDGALLSVRDQGRGIPEDKLDAIFDVFVQAHDADEPREGGGGLGLGLTLVREMARLHGGHVRAKSDGLGHGSTFEVWLPCAESPEDRLLRADAPIEEDRQPAIPRRASLRVLLAEDQPDAARAMSLLLRGWGHVVLHAPRGDDAVRMAKAESPDVVLLDIGLPGMTGWEVAAALRGEEATQETPIAALTGMGQDLDRSRSQEVGFDAHFVKPVDPEVLRTWLASALA